MGIFFNREPSSKSLNAKYLKNKGKYCPYCNSNDLHMTISPVVNVGLCGAVSCDNCKKKWTDLYPLAGAIFKGYVKNA